jgi:hypothetical protein
MKVNFDMPLMAGEKSDAGLEETDWEVCEQNKLNV